MYTYEQELMTDKNTILKLIVDRQQESDSVKICFVVIDNVLFHIMTLKHYYDSISIPEGIKEIKSDAIIRFTGEYSWGGKGLECGELIIPSSVESIGERAFAGMKIDTITIDPANQHFVLKDESLYSMGNEDLVIQAQEANVPVSFEKANKGSIVIFGNYPQEKNGDRRPIEWIVLEKESDRLLLLSKYALDCQPYNEQRQKVSWEESSLREWLNSTFIDTAFNEREQKDIAETIVKTEKSQDCYDHIFLLDLYEVENYITKRTGRCRPTAYMKANGFPEDEKYCLWWLRSPGGLEEDDDEEGLAMFVERDGSVNDMGSGISLKGYGAIRPAMWVKI